MSILTLEEQELFNTAKESLPKVLFQDGMQQELLGSFAKIFGVTRGQIDSWLRETYILEASSFWLDQHAKDRGFRRQVGEGDASLAERIRNYQDMLTKPVIITAINTVLTAAGISGVANIYEERRDRGYFPFGTLSGASIIPYAAGTTSPLNVFYSRGYRMGTDNARHVTAVLPYGTGAETQAAVLDALYQKKAGGVEADIEVRLTVDASRISITPPSAVKAVTATQQFTPSQYLPAGVGAGVTWAVNGVVGGNATVGTISGSGLYTAPVAVPSAPDVVITATTTDGIVASARCKVTP